MLFMETSALEGTHVEEMFTRLATEIFDKTAPKKQKSVVPKIELEQKPIAEIAQIEFYQLANTISRHLDSLKNNVSTSRFSFAISKANYRKIQKNWQSISELYMEEPLKNYTDFKDFLATSSQHLGQIDNTYSMALNDLSLKLMSFKGSQDRLDNCPGSRAPFYRNS